MADNQQLIVSNSDALPFSSQWPEGLKRLLIEGEDGAGASRLISINPTLKRQAEELLPALLRAKAPATEEQTLAILMRHAPTYAVTAKGEAEYLLIFDVYLDALAEFSPYQIEDAFRRWNRGEDMKDPAMGQFFPKPAQLVHLAGKAKKEVWMAAYRAQKALEAVESAAPKVTPEERAKVAEGMKELAASFALKPLPEAVRPALSQHEVAERLRKMGKVPIDDVGIVL